MSDKTDITLFQKLGFTPSRVIRVFGMRRSGNHALINWLMRNASDMPVFLNNCVAGKCPAETARSLEIGQLNMPLDDAKLTEYTTEVPDGEVLIVSYEDFMPDPHEPACAVTTGLPQDVVCTDIILYRDFMNWSASLLKKLQNNHAHSLVSRMRTVLGALETYCEGLELVDEAQAPLHGVNYDRWVAQAGYRSDVLGALGLAAKDNSLGQVQRYGGGSSFQKDVTEAKGLQTHLRWQEMVNDAEYQLILLTASQHRELMDLMGDVMPEDAQLLKTYLAEARFPYHVEFAEEGTS